MHWILPILAFAAVLTGCTGPENRTDLPVNENAAGRKLYYARCAKCHKLYDPAGYSDEEWTMWMKKMKKKAKLSDVQEAMLSLYIDTTLRAKQKNSRLP